MSSTVKAAALSVALLLVAGGVFFFFLGREPKGPRVIIPDEPIAAPAPAPAAPAAPAAGRPLQPLDSEANAVEVTVEVLERGSGRKLRGSSVRVYRQREGDRTGEAVFDSKSTGTDEGVYVARIEPGAYAVHVQCPRYTGERREITVVKGTPSTERFELDRGNSISGRVLDRGGGGIAGARVTALKELGNPNASLEEALRELVKLPEMTDAVESETLSGEDGSYQLDGLRPEWYTVRAVAAGHAPGEVSEVPAPREQVNVVLDEGGNIGGSVRSEGGAPVAGAEVHAYQDIESQNIFDIILSKSRPAVDIARTDESGQFRFETLGSGVYNFLCKAPGYQIQRVLKKKVAPNMPDGLRIVLEPGLVITGVVQDPDGNPVAGARVRAQPPVTSQPPGHQVNITFEDGSVTTDEQGQFVFDTLESGQHTLLCWHEHYQTARRPGVNPGKDEVVIKLDHGGRVSGIVSDGNGRPVAGAVVSATDVADLRKDAVSDEAGHYQLAGLASGPRSLHVTVNAKGFARLRREVKVPQNREVEENFELQPTGVVTGLVVNADNRAIPNACVMVKKSGENASGIEQTVGTGYSDRQGSYQVSDVEAGENLWVVVKSSEYLDQASTAFRLDAGGSVALDPVVMRLGGGVAGRVLAADGKAASGCIATVLFEGQTPLQSAGNPTSPVNARGEFKLSGLEAGTVSLLIKAPHYLEKTLSDIQIVEGQVNMIGDVALDQGNSLAGLVVNLEGKPVSGASVVVRDFAQGAKEITGTTDGEGRFKVDSIRASDSVQLEISHPDYAAYVNESVPVGSEPFEVVLKGLGRFIGVALSPEGTPVPTFIVQPQYQGEHNDPRKNQKPQSFNSTDGSFEYKGVDEGTYTVFVRAANYSTASFENVAVAEGQTVDLGVITLKAGGAVSGRVVDAATQEPISRARVQIVQGASRFLDEAGAEGKPVQFTGESGEFSFTGLKDGDLSLRITLQGYITEKLDQVNPAVSTTSQDLLIKLSRGGEITGIVLGADGAPRQSMPVYLMGADPSSNQSSSTDREGKFRFRGVPAGTFTVKAHKFAGKGERESAETQVDLPAGDARDVVLQLE
jgi:protocatechuate 3,4-dioxygenase beta subunit